jgi:site-specific recombinase XerC
MRSELETFVAREKIAPMTTSRAEDLWLGELARLGHSEKTVATYRRLLDKLSDAYPLVDVNELTATQLRRFLDAESLKQDGRTRKSPATIAQNTSIVCCFFEWLRMERLIKHNPSERIARPKLPDRIDNDNVKTISTQDALKLLEAANRHPKWNRRLAVNLILFLGPRRGATNQLRLRDYDQDERTITFKEKGSKTIRKPVPDALALVLDAAIAAGEYQTQDDYLVPGDAEQRRSGDRDPRIILRLVKEVADEVGVDCHAHALRAAFATAFLESKPGELVALQKLLGHSRVETTMIYLRRLNRRQAMETVRDFAW